MRSPVGLLQPSVYHYLCFRGLYSSAPVHRIYLCELDDSGSLYIAAHRMRPSSESPRFGRGCHISYDAQSPGCYGTRVQVQVVAVNAKNGPRSSIGSETCSICVYLVDPTLMLTRDERYWSSYTSSPKECNALARHSLSARMEILRVILSAVEHARTIKSRSTAHSVSRPMKMLPRNSLDSMIGDTALQQPPSDPLDQWCAANHLV